MDSDFYVKNKETYHQFRISPSRSRHHLMNNDEEQLKNCGYRQEFQRSLSSFSNFGLAFTILSIPASLLPYLYLALQTGGPRGLLITWPIISLASLCVGFSIAEIVSAYPTSGGVYYWAARLSPKGWAPFMSYYTGLFSFIGMWGLGAGTAYEVGVLATSCLYIQGILNIDTTPTTSIEYRSIVVLISTISLIIGGYLNTMSSKVLDKLAKACLIINLFGLFCNIGGTLWLSRYI
jgi:amino acid transporter